MTFQYIDNETLDKFLINEADCDTHNKSEASKMLNSVKDKKHISKIRRFIGSKKRGLIEITEDLDGMITKSNIIEGKLIAIGKLITVYEEGIKECITKRRRYKDLTEVLILDISVITESNIIC